MSSIFSRVHTGLRRTLLALSVTSVLIPAGALAATSAAADGSQATESARPVLGDAVALLPSPEPAPAGPRRAGHAPERAARSRSVPEPAPEVASAPPADPAPPPDPAPADATAVADRAEPAPTAVVFATVAGQPLVLPEAVHGVGFHESSDSRSLALEPVGTATENLNATRITLPPTSAPNPYLVLPSRGRANGATSAVDISVDHGVPVTAPVSGTVEQASPYRLYGRTADELIEIIPDGRPDLRVRLLHVEGAAVAAGDRVEAGVTVVAATARQLPFGSQIDRYAGKRPHVHIEVHPRDPEAEEPEEADADAAPPGG